MKSFYLTDSGKIRDHNEDSVTILKNANNEYLMIVADGMGGHRAGEVASSISVTHLGKKFSEVNSIGTKLDAINWMKENISEINQEILDHTKEYPDSIGMGTTTVMALLTDSYLIFGNIGDSSGYVFKDSQIHKITTDHTLVNLLVKSGEITEEEAKDHPRKNVLMKALGATTTVEMDIFDVETDVDGIFLCSDGLTNMLDNDQISKVLSEDLSVEQMVNKLIIKANNRGGTDNISVAFLKKVGENSDN